MVIVRILVILFAFLCASLSAGLVVTLAVLMPAWSDLAIGPVEEGLIGLALTFGFLFLSGTALLPGLVLIAVAEVLSLRGALFYASIGALTGVAVYASLGHFDSQTWSFAGLARRELEIMAAAGIVGGWVYWLLAGRNAGRWRETRQAVPTRAP